MAKKSEEQGFWFLLKIVIIVLIALFAIGLVVELMFVGEQGAFSFSEFFNNLIKGSGVPKG